MQVGSKFEETIQDIKGELLQLENQFREDHYQHHHHHHHHHQNHHLDLRLNQINQKLGLNYCNLD